MAFPKNEQMGILAADGIEHDPERQQRAGDDAQAVPVEDAAATVSSRQAASNVKMELVIHALTLAAKLPGSG
jgi:hypothetical protein